MRFQKSTSSSARRGVKTENWQAHGNEREWAKGVSIRVNAAIIIQFIFGAFNETLFFTYPIYFD